MADTSRKDQGLWSEIGIPSGLNRIKTRLASATSKHDDSRSYGISKPPPNPKQKTAVVQGQGRTTGPPREGKRLSKWFATYITKQSSYFVRDVPPYTDLTDAGLKVKKADTDESLRTNSSENSMYVGMIAKGLKSFSHELGPRGGIQSSHPRAHSYNDLKELLGSLNSRFDVAKGVVDEELDDFAKDVADFINKTDFSSPEEREMVENLQNLAQDCIEMTSSQLRATCEIIVKDLTRKRQLCQTGPVKWLFTQMLFILTRCTRLLMFQKESEPIDEKSFRKFKECVDSIPAVEMNWISTSAVADSGSNYSTYESQEAERSNHVRVKESSVPETSLYSSPKSVHQNGGAARKDFIVAKKRFPLPKSKFDSQKEDQRFHSEDACQERISFDDSSCGPGNEMQEMLHGPLNEPGQELGRSDSIICRICEEVVPLSHLEPHSYICAYADKCEVNCMNVDERLLKIEEILEQIIDSRNLSFCPQASLESSVLQTTNSGVASEGCSPKINEWRNKGIEGMFEDLHEMDTAFIDDSYLQPINLRSHLGVRLCNNGASSSTGSMTSVSSTNTPRTSHFDSFWLERNCPEQEDTQPMIELSDIARCAAGTDLSKEDSCDFLLACMQDLQDVLKRSKLKALVIDTFGGRIEKLLREKYIYGCELTDAKSPVSQKKQNENVMDNASITSSLSTPHLLHKDRTSIDDFEIIKPISRGAFGKVFLARKRTTGDLFAIKVLKKMDMIRKNDIERIVAERNILITVRNPFVVRFFYSFTCRDNLYLVMEFLNGGDLYSLLRKIGCLEEDIARIYVAELVLALEYLHSLGIVHRDLKPDNILIAYDGHIKLTDFGLSKLGLINNTIDLSGYKTDLPTATDSYHILQKHTEERTPKSAVGTPDYLAPEILLGNVHGYAADWWSVGIILFELITGVPPFTADRPELIFDNILNGKIPWPTAPDDISYEAQDLINRLLIHDPSQRLGATGSTEVKTHPFFKGVNWDNLAMQKAAFVPQPDSVDDTSYFVSRFSQNSYGMPGNESRSNSDTDSCDSYSGDEMDECSNLEEFKSLPLNLSLMNFSYKNLSQLASINHDVLLQTGKDPTKNSPYKSPGT